MGAGNKYEVLNNLERVVSSDFNRLQSFLEADSHEYARWRDNRDIAGNFYNFPGLQQAYTALPADSDFTIAHDCIAGLLVRPDNAGSLLIDPGEAAFFVPAFSGATGDDSKYVIVSDVGVQSLGVLNFTTNGGPGIRWDIVECQPTDVLLESSSRDIYDTGTGLFAPATVPKVRSGKLTYRIRNGTQGNGIPNIASDWMPLAAIHVRTDATGFTNCDVYDIRPLVAERCQWSPAPPNALPVSDIGYRLVMDEVQLSPTRPSGVLGQAVVGYWRSHFGGYWSGGRMRRNTPSASAGTFGGTTATQANVDFFNPAAAENQSSAFSIAVDSQFTVGAFFPRGYPRWVRYSQVALTPSGSNKLRKSGRLPQGPRGILMVGQNLGVSNGFIYPTNMPTVFGETQQAMGHVVVEGVTDGATEFYPCLGGTADNKFYYTGFDVTLASGATPTTAASFTGVLQLTGAATTNGGGTATSMDFTLTRDYPIPPYARGVCLKLLLQFTFSSADEVTVQGAFLSQSTAGVSAPGTPVPIQADQGRTFSSPIAWTYQGTLWLPTLGAAAGWDDDILGATVNKLSVLLFHNNAPTSATALATIVGYQL